MIDSISFANIFNSIDLNTVTNGAGVALKEFTTDVEQRSTVHARALADGQYGPVHYLGRRTYKLEGDILSNTATDYWIRRRSFVKMFAPEWFGHDDELGTLYMTFTGMPQPVQALCYADGWPEIPVGTMGATLSPFMATLYSPDPRLYSQTEHTQTFLANATAALPTALQGDMYTHPKIVITGPITDPIVYIGGTAFQFTYTLSAGQIITINMLERTITHGSGTNLYGLVTTSGDWMPLRPGKNETLQLTGTGTTGESKMDIYYRNAYMI